MSSQLPPEIDQRIQAHLALGGYQTDVEVLNDALDALDQRNADLASVRAGIEDEQAGRLKSVAEVDHDLRQQYDLPARG